MRFGYLRELLTVSKMISSSDVTAIPTSADCGVPLGPIVPRTPNFDFAMKAKISALVTARSPIASAWVLLRVFRSRRLVEFLDRFADPCDNLRQSRFFDVLP